MKLFGTKRNAAHLPEKKRRRGRIVLLVLLICFTMIGGGIYVLMSIYVRPPEVAAFVPPRATPQPELGMMSVPDAEPEPEPEYEFIGGDRPSGIYTILIAGEENSGSGNSDTLILAAIDTLNGGLSLVNIPRDTMVDVPWSVPKINSLLPTRGIEGLMEEVERLAGFMPDNYIVVNLEAFIALVDILGGVYFDVPVRMIYDDPYRSFQLHIRFEPGYQYLDGLDALKVFRFRQNNPGIGGGYLRGDIDRIQTQQNLLRTIAADLLQIRNVTRIRELADIFIEHVETDLPLGSLIYFALQLMDMDSEDINFITMPGNYDYWRHGGSYVLVDLETWLEVVNTYLNPSPLPVTEENVHVVGYRDGISQIIGSGQTLTPRQ